MLEVLRLGGLLKMKYVCFIIGSHNLGGPGVECDS